MAPPERLMALEPAVAPVTVPPQVFVRAGVAAPRSPPGNVSVKASVVIPPLVALLVIVSVIVLTPVPTLVEKLFAIEGVLLTVSDALAATPFAPALPVVRPPIGIVLL